jgi:hypothetical protein
MTPTFEHDIRPLFREEDREAMAWAFDLWNRDDVRMNSEAILERISEGTMPCDRSWPDSDVDKLRGWIEQGSR